MGEVIQFPGKVKADKQEYGCVQLDCPYCRSYAHRALTTEVLIRGLNYHIEANHPDKPLLEYVP